ncbi:hypothetical protein [Phaeodactylibacter luteus]|uniref:Uncharacterized protein n=1 Tax=Phaeodactylibacter luteus TaxID=1564516 RepID=A0A5C6RYH1_9BACT|nr:hypothetical protein [Phaeodactylibacter luteus]TXB67656.1 hypothetical protein FRY97_04505 [Phaeodactylibacter luteus]
MKTFKFAFVLSLLALTAVSTWAKSPDSLTTTKELRKEVARLIDSPDLLSLGVQETFAFVHFEVSSSQEIIVKEVRAQTPEIAQQIRQNLHLHKVSSDFTPGQCYNLKVSFVAEAEQL